MELINKRSFQKSTWRTKKIIDKRGLLPAANTSSRRSVPQVRTFKSYLKPMEVVRWRSGSARLITI